MPVAVEPQSTPTTDKDVTAEPVTMPTADTEQPVAAPTADTEQPVMAPTTDKEQPVAAPTADMPVTPSDDAGATKPTTRVFFCFVSCVVEKARRTKELA